MNRYHGRMFLMVALLGAMLISMVSGAAIAEEKTTIMVAAAASLENILTEKLIPMFEAAHPTLHVEATYDSSGKLQTQIEQGLEADIFLSAAMKQMDALVKEGMIAKDDAKPLLKNQIVLIAPKDSKTDMDAFARITEANTIALGDPDSVPAGQYAKEALTSIGVWDAALAKASLGTNVTEVLHWVAEGSADVGIVYATDAASEERVRVLCEAPEGSLAKPVLYPAGILASTAHRAAAQDFVNFLGTQAAKDVFLSYGFSPLP